MTHLRIFDTDPSIFGYPFEQARFPLFIDLDILRFDLLSDFQIRVSHLRLILWHTLHPRALPHEKSAFVLFTKSFVSKYFPLL